jgi:GNAT superfamily N-acetyltransferase
MYSKWFSTPAPAYEKLVTQLYGAEVGERLNRAYRDELSSRERWSHRLDWSGIVVYEAGEVKAHAVVQVIQDKPLAYVGYVEALNDPAAAGLLVHEIRAELRHKHPGRAVYLPVNQSIWHSYRFKTSGDGVLPFDPPCQPYYGDLFARLFETKELYSSYQMAVPRAFRLEGIDLAVTVRELDAARLPAELRAIYDLSVSIFQDCHSFPSFAEFAALYAGAAGSFNLRYVLIAEAQAVPVGFIFALPLGQAVYIKTLGVAPSAQNRHVGRLLFESICRRARADGYETLYGLFMKNDRLITKLLPPDAEKVAEYTLYRGG